MRFISGHFLTTIKREMPLGEGTIYLYKAALRGKFLWYLAMMPLPSPGQRVVREIKGEAAIQERVVFHSVPRK